MKSSGEGASLRAVPVHPKHPTGVVPVHLEGLLPSWWTRGHRLLLRYLLETQTAAEEGWLLESSVQKKEMSGFFETRRRVT